MHGVLLRKTSSGELKVNESAVADTGPLLHLAEIRQESQIIIFGRVTISDQIEIGLKRHSVLDRIVMALGNRLIVRL